MDTDKIKVIDLLGFWFMMLKSFNAKQFNLQRMLLPLCLNFQIFGSRVRVDSTAKVAEIEQAEKEKMKEKVERILKHGINCFINRYVFQCAVLGRYKWLDILIDPIM